MKFIAMICLSLLFTTSHAYSQQPTCLPRPDAVKQLKKQFKETPRHIGLLNNGSVLEIFSAPNGSTFTIVVTRPDGLSCLMAAGTDLEKLEQPIDGEGI